MPDDAFDEQTLQTLCRQHGFDLPGEVLKKLAAYLELLHKWNRAFNLVGQKSRQDILEDLALDSFHLAGFLNSLNLPAHPECWDFGAGAGIPGIPLRMVWTRGIYTMVEAREKRALFLQNALAACGISTGATRVYRGRAEEFMAERPSSASLPGAKTADLLLSRAFMPWRKFLEFVQGKTTAQGLAVCLTLEETPQNYTPGGQTAGETARWELVASRRYSPSSLHPQKTRYFQAFRQNSVTSG
ncbi:MAG: class I SAM-dependent methyltransferase [Deltaproteobacteria bacterium]|nr:class I SAM-dependent methyltransferase [Deltaproteobacteria bacterium]